MKHTSPKRMVLAFILALLASASWAVTYVEVDDSYPADNPPSQFKTIQAGINAVADGSATTPSVVMIHEGTYTAPITIKRRNYIQLLGEGRDKVTIRPTTTVWHDDNTPRFQYGSTRNTEAQIYMSRGIVLDGITWDAVTVKSNSHTMVAWNQTDGAIRNCKFMNNQIADESGGYTEMALQIRAKEHYNTPTNCTGTCTPIVAPDPIFTPASRAVVEVTNNIFENVGRLGVHVHANVYLIMEDNQLYKTWPDFGYGTDLGSWSCGEVRRNSFWGFDRAALSDGSIAAGIYLSNSFTLPSAGYYYPYATPVPKVWTIEDNDVTGCQWGVWLGLDYDNLGGACPQTYTFNGNNIHANNEGGLYIVDTNASRGSSIEVNTNGNTIADNGVYGIHMHTNGDGNLTANLNNDTITGNEIGVFLSEYEAFPTRPSTYNVDVHDSNLGGNATGVENTVGGGVQIDANGNWWGGSSGAPADYIEGDVDTSTSPTLAAPASDDRDGDGLKNWNEDKNGDGVLDPGETDPDDVDTDDDGYDDGVEIQLGTNPRSALSYPNNPYANSTADTDGDGYKDKYEVAMGTDPTNPASKPTLGDTNGSGSVDNVDAVRLYASTLGYLDLADFTGERSDADRNGLVNNADAIIIFNYFLANISSLPSY